MTLLEKTLINRSQLWLLIVNFEIGSALFFTPSVVANITKQDGWISFLLAILFGTFIILIVVQLAKYYPSLTLIDISQIVLGKTIGKFIGILYIFFFLYLSSLLLFEVSNMIQISLLRATPTIVLTLLISILIYMSTTKGIEVIARSNEFFTPIAFIGFWLTLFLAIPQMEWKNLLPVFSVDMKTIVKGSLNIQGLTYFEIAVFLMIIPFLNQQKNLTKIMVSGGIFAGLTLLVIFLSSILVLGSQFAGLSIFSPIGLASTINIADFLTRLETLLTMTYVITLFTKMIVSFYSGVIATAQIFDLGDYRPLILPSLIITIIFSLIVPGIVGFLTLIKTAWIPYALLFNVILPLFFLVITYMRQQRQKN